MSEHYYPICNKNIGLLLARGIIYRIFGLSNELRLQCHTHLLFSTNTY